MCLYSLVFRVQLPRWVAHTVPLVHTEVQVHMVLQDHPDPQGLPWAHTTLAHTTRDLQDHSMYSLSGFLTSPLKLLIILRIFRLKAYGELIVCLISVISGPPAPYQPQGWGNGYPHWQQGQPDPSE